MGVDLDPLDDIFAEEEVKNARAGGKFQPNRKFRPPKRGSAAIKVSSSPAWQTSEYAQSELSKPVRTAKPSEHFLDVAPNDNAGWHASMNKSVGENADIFIGLEAIGDFLPHTNTDMEGTVTQDSTHTCEVADVPTCPELSEDLDHLTAGEPIVSSSNDHGQMHDRELGREEMDVMDSVITSDVPTCPELSEDLDPLTAGEPIVSSSGGRGQMHDRELEREVMDDMDSVITSELTTKHGQRTGKFQPKPKIQMHKEKEICESNRSVSNSQSVPPEINYGEKESISTFQHDDVLDLSSLGFTHTLTNEVSSEVPLNGEPVNLKEMNQLDSSIHLASVPEVPAKLAARRAKTGSSSNHTASDPSPQQQKVSPSTQENKTGRSLRPRKTKTNFCELVDEPDDEVLASGEFSDECPLSSAMEEENIGNEELQVESKSQMKKVKRKPKQAGEDKEKPARKRKKAKESSDQDADAKPKKFFHSTRRRRVNKALLETPEEEIDYQKVPFRDLILLAEHKERQTKKEEAAAAAVPATNPSNGNSSSPYDETETFTSNQGGECDDGQGSPRVDSTVYFNYHTYMDKKPTRRWSKRDTELFYEAIQQFGTDFSLIQQLFPDRTRRQITSKYRKESQWHPLRLCEALADRSKDHSLFQMVIERLKQIAAEENQNADKDDTIDLTGNEVADEGISNADDEEAKDEGIEEEENGYVANDFIEVQSPIKSDDGEGELFWSQYKSDT